MKYYWFQTCLRKKFHARATSSSSSASTAFPRSQKKKKKKVSTRVSFRLERGEKTGTRMRMMMMMMMAVVEFPDLNPHYNNNQHRWEQLQPKTNSRCSRQKQNEWTREESTVAYTTHIIVQGAEEATTQRNTQRHTHTHTQDDKDARQEELERAWDWRHKTAKGTSFRAQQELEVEGIWGIERKGNGKGER